MSESSLLIKAVRKLWDDGPTELREAATEYSREKYLTSEWRNKMPGTGNYQIYNGFRVRERRIFDKMFLGEIIGNKPNYEGQYVEYIREYVTEGETVVLIGGYYGISTVAAASQVGKTGTVLTFEATKEGCEMIRRTAELNGLEDRITVKQGIVGPVKGIKANTEVGNQRTEPEDLPECDTLAIDCDGCELTVLDNIRGATPQIIVEHHGGEYTEAEGLSFEYQEDVLENILISNCYNIVDKTVKSRNRDTISDHIGWFVAQNSVSTE